MTLAPDAPQLSTNDYLRSASTFHSLYAICAQLGPVKSTGIEMIEADTFNLHCYQTATGVKFFMTSTPGTRGVDETLRQIYELYSDYVLKNPFHEADMPIRSEKWTRRLLDLVGKRR